MTKKKFQLFKGPASANLCKFAWGSVKIFLELLETDVVTYSDDGFSIGSHQYRYVDLASLDLLEFNLFASGVGLFPVKHIQVALNDSQEFAMFPNEGMSGGVVGWHKLNGRTWELFQQLNGAWRPIKQAKYSPHIKRTILDLGTKFSRLQVAEIAETSKVRDAAIIIEVIQDLIAKHEIDAQYFASTQSIAFRQGQDGKAS